MKRVNMPHTTGDVGAGAVLLMVKGVVGAAGVGVGVVEGDVAVVKFFQLLEAEERNLINVAEGGGGEGVTWESGTSATWTRTPRSGSTRGRRPRPGRPPAWPPRSARITAASRLRRSVSSSRRLEDPMKEVQDIRLD